jgi:uncharacterized protein (TIGR02996 family)
MKEEAFLKQVLEQPDDEVVRLAYADWLMERGDPESAARGEFIQVQCALARRADPGGKPDEWVDSARLPRLKAREQALLAAYGDKWARPVYDHASACAFRRGFVEDVTLDPATFARDAGKLFTLAPIRRVRFTGGAVSAELVRCRFLRRLAGLDFQRQNLGDAGLRTLLSSPHLTGLRELDLSYNRLTDVGARALAESPYLAQLTSLNLGYNALSLAGVRALYESPHWPAGLRRFVLAGNTRIDRRALEFLAQTLQGEPDPATLRSLLQLRSLEEREYTNAQVRELARKAGEDPTRAAEVLAEAVRGPHRKLRVAAAQMLAQLGPAAAPAVPALVQRLFERGPRFKEPVGQHVARSLARLLPDLPADLQSWLCLLANPVVQSPLANLKAALGSARLPESVRREFALVCARRVVWRNHVASGKPGEPAYPDPARVASDVPSILRAVETLGTLAQRAAQKGLNPGTDPQAHKQLGELGRDKEHAWLLARLCECIQATLPAGKRPR